jgi:hypothetical protein
MTTFKLRVSKNAERLNFDEIPEIEKKILFAGIKFNPDTHDVYRFFVVPELDSVNRGSKRTQKRKDFSLADKISVKVEAPFPGLSFIGIFPITTTVAGTHDEIRFPIIGDLRPKGIAKEFVKRGKHAILAERTDDFACWFFLKPYIESGQSYRMEAVCIVPKSLPLEQRYLRCDASVMHKGRELKGAYARRILLPPSN